MRQRNVKGRYNVGLKAKTSEVIMYRNLVGMRRGSRSEELTGQIKRHKFRQPVEKNVEWQLQIFAHFGHISLLIVYEAFLGIAVDAICLQFPGVDCIFRGTQCCMVGKME